jgi:hypothetical protein
MARQAAPTSTHLLGKMRYGRCWPRTGCTQEETAPAGAVSSFRALLHPPGPAVRLARGHAGEESFLRLGEKLLGSL